MVEGMVEGMLGVHFGAKSIVLQRKNKVLSTQRGSRNHSVEDCLGFKLNKHSVFRV